MFATSNVGDFNLRLEAWPGEELHSFKARAIPACKAAVLAMIPNIPAVVMEAMTEEIEKAIESQWEAYLRQSIQDEIDRMTK